MSVGSAAVAARVVAYAVVGALMGSVPAWIAKESVLSPGWEAGWKHFGNGLIALLVGIAGGAGGALLGVVLARRQLRPQGVDFDDPAPILSLPSMAVLGAFLGSIVAGGLWGALVVAALVIGLLLIGAQ